MKTLSYIIMILVLATVSGCEAEDSSQRGYPGDRDGDQPDNPSGDPQNNSDTGNNNVPKGNTSAGCSGMDILFVVDDSGSMQEEQENLANNFPQFVSVLDKYRTSNGSSLDYRLAVTTTGVNRVFKQNLLANWNLPTTTSGPTGLMLGRDGAEGPDCGLDKPWLESTDSNVTDKFSCMAQVGTMGSGTEMPFAALEAALGTDGNYKSRPGGPNEGFYRKNADSLLVVVIITDEDDCSIEKNGVMYRSTNGAADCNENKSKGLYVTEDIKKFLDNLTGGEDRYVVVGIAGPKDCTSDFGSAINAKRVKDLVELVGDNGVFGDICEGNLWINLEQALETMTVACTDMGPLV